VKESFLLLRSQVAQHWHQLFEGLFVFQEALMLGLREEIEDLNEFLEFWL
jgi:hypothetical protein